MQKLLGKEVIINSVSLRLKARRILSRPDWMIGSPSWNSSRRFLKFRKFFLFTMFQLLVYFPVAPALCIAFSEQRRHRPRGT